MRTTRASRARPSPHHLDPCTPVDGPLPPTWRRPTRRSAMRRERGRDVTLCIQRRQPEDVLAGTVTTADSANEAGTPIDTAATLRGGGGRWCRRSLHHHRHAGDLTTTAEVVLHGPVDRIEADSGAGFDRGRRQSTFIVVTAYRLRGQPGRDRGGSASRRTRLTTSRPPAKLAKLVGADGNNADKDVNGRPRCPTRATSRPVANGDIRPGRVRPTTVTEGSLGTLR